MVTVTDIFAGAGGSSTGAASVPGVHVAIAANHWRLAVAVHQENHQATEHACVDLHMEDPRWFPRTDVLWASPECTKWSIANSKAKELSVEMGGDPTLFDSVPAELETGDEDEISRSRLLMFDVLRFVEYHRYRMVVVENVVDIATQPKYRAAWRAWQAGLRKLGYAYRVLSINSMHAQLAGPPAPQSRDRLYIVAWPQTERAPVLERVLRPWAWCDRCSQDVEARQAWKPGRDVGRYRAQYVYACPACGHQVEPGWMPASTAIDWTLPAQRIADRKKPLSPKTMDRIREGLRRYGTGHILDRRGDYRVRDLSAPLSTITANETTKALVIEAAGNTYDAADPKHPRHGQPGAYMRAWPVTDPLRTLHTSISKGLLLTNTFANRVRETSEAMPTLTTATTQALLVPVEGRDGKQASTASIPLRTQTCRNETGLLVPYYSGSTHAKPTSEPIGTLTTLDKYALITLRGTNTPKPISGPLDTVAASGNHHGLLNITEDDVMACRFRMLEPHEIAAGMAFPSTYLWQGTKRERVRLAGNAVTPPVARDLLTVISQHLEAS